MGVPEVLLEGVVFGESPRWHDGRLWFSDWGANQVIAVGSDGSHQVVVTVASVPVCIDFLPDGRLLWWILRSGGCCAMSPTGRWSRMLTCPKSRPRHGVRFKVAAGSRLVRSSAA